MNKTSFIVAPILIFLLSACAASGPKYSEVNTPQLSSDRARIFILRESSIYASAQTAKIDVDGERVGALAVGGYLLTDVTPGSHIVAASDMWTTSSLTIQVQPRSITYLNVSASPMSSSGLLYLGGLAGAVVASSSEDGFYKISSLSGAEGNIKLASLSLSQ